MYVFETLPLASLAIRKNGIKCNPLHLYGKANENDIKIPDGTLLSWLGEVKESLLNPHMYKPRLPGYNGWK